MNTKLKELGKEDLKNVNGGLIVEVIVGAAIGWLLGRLIKAVFNNE